MAVSAQYSASQILSDQLGSAITYKSEDVVTISTGGDTDVGGKMELVGNDQSAMFLVTHNGTAGTIALTVQQSSDDGSADAYASVTNGLINPVTKAPATTYTLNMTAATRFIKLSVNPQVITEKWVRVQHVTNASGDATSVRIVGLTNSLRSVR